jgi:tetratricopeptide (TPR) repeat protein
VPHLEKAIQLDPGFGIAYFNLGNAHINLDNLDEARKAYDMAVEKGIDFLSLHWNLHKIHSRQGRSVDAKRELEIILQIDPQNPDAQKKLKELSR